MAQSQTIGKLAEALAKAQTLIASPKKDKTAKIKSDKGQYEYTYADLASVLDAARKPLGDNGLSLVQPIGYQDGHMLLRTVLLHVSGEWIDSEYPIPAFARAQEQGSAITYARRYAASAFLGIAAEDDDDGKAATDGASRHETEQEDAPPSGDASVIMDLALALSELPGEVRAPEDIIVTASAFTDKAGKKVPGFTDPRKKKAGKWLELTRQKLERELQAKGAIAAVGDEEIPF